jgi:hypothetical protein
MFRLLCYGSLMADSRRLALGEPEGFDARALVTSIYPFLSTDQRGRLENHILEYNPRRKIWGVDDLRCWGIYQMFLLQCFPRESLAAQSVRRLSELERKFPGVGAPLKRGSMGGGMVESPIDHEFTVRMNDRAWLRAMRKYCGNVEHPAFLKGGSHELANVLMQYSKDDPIRFHRLAMKMALDTDAAYVMAVLQGISQSPGHGLLLYETVRRFSTRSEDRIRLTIAHCLSRPMERGEVLPIDLIDLLEDYVHDDAEVMREGDDDPFTAAINSRRGTALLALARSLSLQDTDEARQRIWTLVEEMLPNSSPVLPAAALEPLWRELHTNPDYSVDLYASS